MTPAEMLAAAESPDLEIREYLARNTAVLAEAQVKLAGDSSAYVREYLARNTAVLAELQVKLAGDSSASVREYLARNTAVLAEALRIAAEQGGIAADIRKILSAAAPEVPELLATLREGRIDGTTYHGACKCLAGTIAAIRHCSYKDLSGDLKANAQRPAEVWFAPIRPGHTPANNARAAATEGIIVDWMASRPSAQAGV